MKKKLFLVLTIVVASVATLTLNNLQAQNDTTPPAPAPAAPPIIQRPVPGPRPGLPPGMRRNVPGISFRQAVGILRHAKMELEHSKEDYDGHRQTAMDACDKAIQEMEAVLASIQAKAKTAPPPTQPAAPTAPTPPPTQ